MKVLLFVCALIFVSMLSNVSSTDTDEFEENSSDSLGSNTDDFIKYIDEIDSDNLDSVELDSNEPGADASDQNDFDPNSLSHNALGEISFGPNGFQREAFGQYNYGQFSYGQDQNKGGVGDFVHGLFGIQTAEALTIEQYHGENPRGDSYIRGGRGRGGGGGGGSTFEFRDRKIQKTDNLSSLLRRFPSLNKAFVQFAEEFRRLDGKRKACERLWGKVMGKGKTMTLAVINYGKARALLKFVARLRRAKWSKQDVLDFFSLFLYSPNDVERIMKKLKNWYFYTDLNKCAVYTTFQPIFLKVIIFYEYLESMIILAYLTLGTKINSI